MDYKLTPHQRLEALRLLINKIIEVKKSNEEQLQNLKDDEEYLNLLLSDDSPQSREKIKEYFQEVVNGAQENLKNK
jgi:small nuclear ribonucleoprotein (snRNP)-like protein